MPKFKVGDKVVVLPRKEGQRYQEPCYVDEMTNYVGQTFTIDWVDDRPSNGRISFDEIGFTWHQDWVEPYSKPIESAADMDALYA